jgi:hypothetical protein
MNAFRLLRRQSWLSRVSSSVVDLDRLTPPHVVWACSCLRDTIPLQFNRRLRCPLAVSYDAAIGTIR